MRALRARIESRTTLEGALKIRIGRYPWMLDERGKVQGFPTLIWLSVRRGTLAKGPSGERIRCVRARLLGRNSSPAGNPRDTAHSDVQFAYEKRKHDDRRRAGLPR